MWVLFGPVFGLRRWLFCYVGVEVEGGRAFVLAVVAVAKLAFAVSRPVSD